MFTNTLEFQGFKPFDHIAGCSLGTWTDRETAYAIIKTMCQAGNDVCNLWEELAKETDDNIDVDYYSQELTELCADLLPSWCFFAWEDGEFRVTPDVENAQFDLERIDMTGDELPEDGTPGDEFLVISDHGNATLYFFEFDNREWREVWSVV